MRSPCTTNPSLQLQDVVILFAITITYIRKMRSTGQDKTWLCVFAFFVGLGGCWSSSLHGEHPVDNSSSVSSFPYFVFSRFCGSGGMLVVFPSWGTHPSSLSFSAFLGPWGYWLSPFMGAFVIDYDNQQLRFFGGLGNTGCLPFMGKQL